jgi:uncharacterized protein YndB with AHSA1/START domain
MRTIDIAATARADAPPATVWSILADTAGWPRWSPNDHAELERPGTPIPDGVGAIRVLRTRRVVVREQITVFDAPRRLQYRLLSGLPVRDYQATVTLVPDGTGTRIEWSATFRSAVPGLGWLLRPALRRVLHNFASALAAAPAAAIPATASPGRRRRADA